MRLLAISDLHLSHPANRAALAGLGSYPDDWLLLAGDIGSLPAHLRQALAQKMGRTLTIGRVAHLTAPLAHSPHRGTCQNRNLCIRGCPYGAYFSSNSSTLPAAEKTGNMTLRPNSIVYELIYDESRQRASGVRVLDGSLGGIGGCPYAPGASGNVATEDVVHMLECMGYHTGMNLDGLLRAAAELARLVGHDLPSQVSRAGHRLTRHSPPADFDAIRERALARDQAAARPQQAGDSR